MKELKTQFYGTIEIPDYFEPVTEPEQIKAGKIFFEYTDTMNRQLKNSTVNRTMIGRIARAQKSEPLQFTYNSVYLDPEVRLIKRVVERALKFEIGECSQGITHLKKTRHLFIINLLNKKS